MKEHLLKLDEYYEAVTSKKQQRSELTINNRSCALNMKISTQMNSLNQRLEDLPKNIRLNKRVRTSLAESRECKSNGLKKQHVSMEKDGTYIEDKGGGGGSDLFAEMEGWDKKVKRKRSVGTLLTKSKAVTMVASRSNDGVTNCKPPRAPWVGQRPPKMPRTRKENPLPSVSNHDEKQLSFNTCPPMASNDSHVFRKSSNGPYKLIVRFDNVHQSSPHLSESQQPIRGGQSQLKGKEKNKPFLDKESVSGWKQGRGLTNCNKNVSKPGRGLKRKGLSDYTHVQDSSSPDCTGVSDDDDQEELFAAANHARVATHVACSSPFWKKMEPLFSSVSSEDKSLLSQQVDILQTCNESPPLYQRVLSALITEEDFDDGIQESDSRITHFQKRVNLENGDSQYEHMSLEDKLLLELQSLGLFPDNTLPGLDDKEDETIQHEVHKLKTSLHQQEVKKKGYLETINEGVESDTGDLETRAMDRLVELADKKLTQGIRRSSRLGIDKGPNQSALAFGKRTLARCHKFEKSGTSVFNEPPLKDILYDPTENEPEAVASTKYIVSRNSHLLSDGNAQISNRGKNKSLLLDDMGTAAVRGKRSKRATTRKPKSKPSKKTDVPSVSSGGRCVNNPSGSAHPVQPRVNVPFLPVDDDLEKIEELGGGNDLDCLLNFDEKDPEVDLDFAGGLDIPMDNLEELGMF